MKRADRRKQSQSGFTLMEVLVTVAILICLLALSFVAITKYIRHVQITELDTAAREIYMAAQNQAILLNSGGQLSDCVIKTDVGGAAAVPAENQMDNVEVTPNAEDTTQITAYYIASDDPLIAQLLPETSIESDLWKGKFYIVYEPVSGSVIDVFFAKDQTAFPDEEEDFRAFYDTWRAAPKEDRMNNKPMIGYYGGDSAESGNTLSLRTPVIKIYNEDELRAEITYWIPRTLSVINSANPDMTEGVKDGVKLDVELSYDGKKIPLKLPNGQAEKDEKITFEYTAITYIFKLDTLEKDHQFKDLFKEAKDSNGLAIDASDLTMGKDFTITASVSYEGKTDGMQVNGARKSATDNSLFAKGSGDATAKIAYMRHLQNLDAVFSGVEEKTAAKQIADITCDESYSFIPVENEKLTSYDGGRFHIKELHVDAEKTQAEYSKSAYGLFGRVSGMTLSNIKMVNAQVDGGEYPAGALAGRGTNLTIKDCGVYWENTSADSSNLRYALGDSEKGIQYKVTGGTAGGLAGQMSGSITGSFAATTIKGNTAGGLVGKADGSLRIEKSYGDNYLAGNQAAGLIGNLSGTANVTDSYATGFINSENGDKAAGFCLGNGEITSNRAYSTMLFSQGADNYALSKTKGSYDKTYYLDSAFIKHDVEKSKKPYADLTDAKKIDNLYGTEHKFAMKTTQTTFPYNLQTTLNLTRYSYPGLADMDHYGDWGAEFQNGSLVYFERYKKDNETAYAFNGANLSMITDDYAVEDGYALAFLSTGNIAQTGTTVTVTYKKDQGDPVTETLTYSSDEIKKVTYHNPLKNKDEDYFLLPLPDRIVNTEYAAKDFYQEISFTRGNDGEQTTGHYYYNPHFANAVLEYEDGMNLEQEARKTTAKIRTARHLYMLSEHEEYFSNSHPYKFKQEMDIDYSIYEGYGIFPAENDIRVYFQTPIGNGNHPFKGTYDGGCHTIENVGVSSAGSKRYVGLFGYSEGTIGNAAYLINENTVGTISSQRSTGTVYIGGLAGYNGGLIENCAVAGMEINAYAYEQSTILAGGLVGWNRGTIRNSSAALTSLTVDTTLSNSAVGGFVGRNGEGGDIKKCYAVGRVNIEKSRYGEVVAGGFAGVNKGTVTKSYAAVDLQNSGGAAAFGFCQDETSKSNYYMNDGNFSYNKVNYTAQYEDCEAQPKKWSAFTDKAEETGLYKSLGMSAPETAKAHEKQDGKEVYPYPGIVKDGEGNYIHYGMWPELMNLNQGGIYYWEKMEGLSNKPSYYLSAIIVDPKEKTIEKIDTLSNKHGDGGIVTEYGYGYFTPKDVETVTLSSKDVEYGNKGETVYEWIENTDCNEALEKLLENKYVFHSYNTGKMNADGLYLTSKTKPYGTWTLTFKDGTEESEIDFNINPFFADSMTLEEKTNGWNVEDVSVGTPGSDEKTSFQVRSVDQLQFINWNVEKKNTNTVLVDGNKDQFLFLGYKSAARKYFWKQTHDLQGEEGKTYTPIAELYDTTTDQTGTLYGWFGGTYDGDDYVIQDVNIKGQTSSCAGLFGMVYDGTLKNIIMYSPTGTGKVIAGSSKESDSYGSAWYAIGGLAGFAATRSGNDASAIENCAIAGYTIEDRHEGGGGWGGTCMGGLIGVSCMDLKNCTAVTNLDSKVQDNDNVRIGGLVGTCQRSISSCYAGGSIDVEGAKAGPTHGIYIGGIVGGVYFKPLKEPGGNQIGDQIELANTLRNCYSYVILPDVGKDIKALFAVGGPGELERSNAAADWGYTTYENCYYLNDVVWSNNGDEAPVDKVRCDVKLQSSEQLTYWSSRYNRNITITAGDNPAWPGQGTKANPNVTAMTYAQMSNGTLLEKLNAKAAGFATVTTETADGNKINGKYSFTSDPTLIGEDYPFPTILTQKDKGSKEVNVHYGAWPVEGLSREHGSIPIDMDLFADYADGSASKTEKIYLSSMVKTGGTLKCEVLDGEGKPLEASAKPIVRAEIEAKGFTGNSRTAELKLTALQAGSAKVKVTYTIDGREYTAFVDVQITAELQLLPVKRPVSMFTDETASVVLEVKNKNGGTIDGDLLNGISLKNITAELESDYLSDAKVTKDGNTLLLSLTSNAVEDISRVTLDYSYEYKETTYPGTNPVSVEIANPVIKLDPLEIYLDGSDQKTVKYGKADGAEEVDLTVAGNAPVSIEILQYEQSENQQLAFVDSLTDGTLEMTIRKLEAAGDVQSTRIRLKLRFTIDGVTHESWQYLQVNVHSGSKPETP